jgi:hypothetical protein
MCTLSKEYLRSQYKVAVADFKMAQDDDASGELNKMVK